jgi:hypothetical protein
MGAPVPRLVAVQGPTAQCAYCGRYGALGICPGCGAPNRPVGSRVEITGHGDTRRQFLAPGAPPPRPEPPPNRRIK